MEPGSGRDDDLIVARVRRAHGLRGELLVSVDTDRPRQVFRPGRMLRLADGRGERSGRSVRLEGMRATTGGAILRLDGVTNREEAEALRGSSLLIAAADAAPPGPDEVHYRDLIGLSALDGEVPLGSVADILENPSGEILVIRRSNGGEILVPFAKELVAVVDLERCELKLRLPEGFLEI